MIAPAINIRFTKNNLPHLVNHLVPAMAKTMRFAATNLVPIMVKMQENAGVWDTGETGRSTEIKEEASSSFEYVVGPRTHYAIYQEFGTRYIPARPWMRPALERHEPWTLRALQTAIDKIAGGGTL